MTYASANHPASTPFRTSIAATLTAAGFTRVTQDYSPQANWLIDVWKSPAAGNAAGLDWYLIVADQISGSNRIVNVTVCEGWDDATKTATQYVPTSNNVTPAGDFSVGATGVAPTSANLAYNVAGTWVDTAGVSYKVTATTDRVVFQIAGSVSPQSWYCGHLDRMYPAAVDPVALVTLRVDAGSGSASTSYGGSTREPGQTAASAYNFRVQICTGAAVNYALYSANLLVNADPITGKTLLSPVYAVCSKNATSSSQSGVRRALLKDLRTVGISGTAGDTATEIQSDGSTRNLWAVGWLPVILAGQL